ncbi:hypothetical protein [Flagellimonas myxillae]|uniref:hypothetical protein n=1 Tax=Flagellimonas myxillae TaxID=2942214 RepID=UPI00201F2F24|nr:hypothetical protein [Muricauda myxillae]MCL6267214.1 hypothetical protein [Muricauda myxillae]
MLKKLIYETRERIRPNLLAISIGFVYLWFGSLKFFPDASPAESLAKNTIHQLTLGVLPDSWAIILLAILEVGIGLLLLLGLWRKFTVGVALAHMALTFAPLILFPLESFQQPPLIPTLLGQYIGKNLIIVAALLSLPHGYGLLKNRLRNKN